MKRLVLVGLALYQFLTLHAQNTFTIRGQVFDSKNKAGVVGAIVSIVEQPSHKAVTDTAGRFQIEAVKGGIVSICTEAVSYRTAYTPDYIVSATTPFIHIGLDEDIRLLQDVTVRPSPFRRSVESPVSMQVIGVREIEKMPGSNRDITRIVRSYPGVSFSPIGYRNDLIVRGGGPSENAFYLDGIEIPNINHFATQGASGGPVSLINADLIREIRFYTGAFPVNRSGTMSSVLDISLREGNKERQSFKTTLGSSEASISGSGHIGIRTTYLFSIRQSYLQLLFKVLGLPFLPNYIDGQINIKTRIRNNDEWSFLVLTGIDRMKLNLDIAGDEGADYLLGYLPVIRQETFTIGTTYRHQIDQHTQTYILSHNFLKNGFVKYIDNDNSRPDKLRFRQQGKEQKTSFRAENHTRTSSGWSFKQGIRIDLLNSRYRERKRSSGNDIVEYNSTLNIICFSVFASSEYRSDNEKFQTAIGLSIDGNNYNHRMLRIWQQLSPRASFRYNWNPHWSAAVSTGLYHQLPPLTALAFRETNGTLVNSKLRYMQVWQQSAGIEWKHNEHLAVSVEAFHKYYQQIPVSAEENIPLTCKGADYGIIGNEPLKPIGKGRAYGVELLTRWTLPEQLHLTGSLTWYRSLYKAGGPYIPSSWDNQFILNVSSTYNLPKGWSIGARLSAIGGSPFTPYNEQRSSLVDYWNANGRPALDYERYNALRLPAFAQLDLRIDKDFYFKKWRLSTYIDLQNVTVSKLRQQDALVSTGQIANPEASASEQRYVMKHIRQSSGTLIPGIGITAEF